MPEQTLLKEHKYNIPISYLPQVLADCVAQTWGKIELEVYN